MEKRRWIWMMNSIILLALASTGEAERRGEAVFDRLGDMAQPAFYTTTAFKFSFDASKFNDKFVNETLERKLFEAGKSLTRSGLNSTEVESCLNYVREHIAEAAERY